MIILKVVILALSLIGGVTTLFFHKKMPRVFIWVGWFMVFAFISQLTGIILKIINGVNSGFYNFVLLVNFCLLFLIVIHLFKRRYNQIRVAALFFVSGVAVAFFVWISMTDQFTTKSLTITNLTVTIACFYYLYVSLNIPETLPISRQGTFWIAMALLVYHVSSFTFWLMFGLVDGESKIIVLMYINYTLVIVLYLLLILATFTQIKFGVYDRNK